MQSGHGLPGGKTAKGGKPNSSRGNGRRRSKGFGATAVGAFLPDVTRRAFEKFGFPAAQLLTDWQAIAGPELASYTAPERIKWPRTPKGAPDIAVDMAQEEATSGHAGTQGATLVLKVEGPRAIEIQHRKPQVIERVNAYFGYAAITDLRILQAPVHVRHPMPDRSKPRHAIGIGRRQDTRGDTRGSGLDAALARLGQGVAAARSAKRNSGNGAGRG